VFSNGLKPETPQVPGNIAIGSGSVIRDVPELRLATSPIEVFNRARDRTFATIDNPIEVNEEQLPARQRGRTECTPAFPEPRH
jgi:hypothetical protein